MENVKLDERGRLLLAKEIREEYGDEFVVVRSIGELVLIPVPKDPLKALRMEGKKLPEDMSVKDLKSLARNLILKEVMDEADEREEMRKRLQKEKK